MNQNLSHINQVSSHDYSDNPKAGFGTRFIAILIDSIVVQLIYSFLVAVFVRKAALSEPMFLLQSLFFYWLVYFLIICLPLYSSGQTLGKTMLKIRVIAKNGSTQLTMRQILVREFGMKSFVATFTIGIGYLWYFRGERGETWQDLVAKTEVISLKV